MMSNVRMQLCFQVLHFGLHLTTACQGLLSSEHKIQKDGVTYHPFGLQTLALSCILSLPCLATSACLLLQCSCVGVFFSLFLVRVSLISYIFTRITVGKGAEKSTH